MKPMLAQAGDENWLLAIESDPNWVATKKWDGIRLLLFLNNSGNRLLTRSGRNVISKTPQFQQIIPELDDTILDSEGVVSSNYLGDIQSIIQSKYATSASKNARLILFDCLRYKGEILIHNTLRERRVELKLAAQILRKHGWKVSPESLVRKGIKGFYNREVAAGGEGVMTKDLLAYYYPNQRPRSWMKVKVRNTYDFIILGFTDGTGKYSDQIGAIKYGAYYEGELIQVGKSSGMTDKERWDMSINPRKYINKVAEFEAQEITRSGAMRHPEYIQMRPDLKPIDIQLENYLF